jgi:hypothetical protein
MNNHFIDAIAVDRDGLPGAFKIRKAKPRLHSKWSKRIVSRTMTPEGLGHVCMVKLSCGHKIRKMSSLKQMRAKKRMMCDQCRTKAIERL